MKIKAEISIVLALLMIVSTFTVVAGAGDFSPCYADEHGELQVIKEVYYEGEWTSDPVELNLNDEVEFRINITYINNSGEPGTHYAHQIRVNDSLPNCLDYVSGTADPTENESSGDPDEWLLWDFGSQRLYDGDSIEIHYNATVVNFTDQDGEENVVFILWDEHCTGGNELTVETSIIVTVPTEPALKVVKEVKVNGNWLKNITTYPGEKVDFRINVSNPGDFLVFNITLNDTLPPFLTYFDSSDSPMVNGQFVEWDIPDLGPEEWYLVNLSAMVDSEAGNEFGLNTANVTGESDEGFLEDSDYVEITVVTPLIFEKKVKHPFTGEWVDELPFVLKCEPVRFRLELSYFGDERMKCLVIYDQLPIECLEYANNVYVEIKGQEITPDDVDNYPEIFLENDTFEMCDTPTTVEEGQIYFSWIDSSLLGGLIRNDTVVVEFDTNVIEYCIPEVDCQECDCLHINLACAYLWSCNGCSDMLIDCDEVVINCTAPPGKFEKKVSRLEQPPDWQDELTTVQGYVIQFKLELTYYGNQNLSNVSFYDELPCCLEYKETLEAPPGTQIEVEDSKHIWWNVTTEVSDCDIVTIIFSADVVGTSACGGCINYGYVKGYRHLFCDQYELIVDEMDSATVYSIENGPPFIPDITGPTMGLVGQSLEFTANLQDPDDDQMEYKFDFGDETTSWLGPVSGGNVDEVHTYTAPGTYLVRAKAKDEHGLESDWTTFPLSVEINEADITISYKMVHISTITAKVENTGSSGLSDIDYTFHVKKDGIFEFLSLDEWNNGTISSIAAGNFEEIQSGPLGFHFGYADVEVTCSVYGIEAGASEVQALLLGPIALIM